MKKLFVGFGKALLYVLLFIGVQFLVSIVGSMAIGLRVGVEYAVAHGGMITDRDTMIIADLVMERLLEQTMLLSIISGIVTVIILLIFFAVRRKNLFKEIRLKKLSVGNAILCVIFGLGLNFAVSFIIGIIPFPESWVDSYIELSGQVTYGSTALMIIATVIIAPIAEEIIFRGLVFTRLRRVLPQVVAVILASAAFGIVHGNIIWFIYTFILALVINFVYIRYQSLLASILLHFGFNAAGTMMSFIPEDVPELLNIVYLAVCLICLAVSVLMLLLIAGTTKENRIFVPDKEPEKNQYQIYQQYQPIQYYQPLQSYVQYAQPSETDAADNQKADTENISGEEKNAPQDASGT